MTFSERCINATLVPNGLSLNCSMCRTRKHFYFRKSAFIGSFVTISIAQESVLRNWNRGWGQQETIERFLRVTTRGHRQWPNALVALKIFGGGQHFLASWPPRFHKKTFRYPFSIACLFQNTVTRMTRNGKKRSFQLNMIRYKTPLVLCDMDYLSG